MNNLEMAIESESKAAEAFEKATQKLAAAKATLEERKNLFIDDPSKYRRQSKREAEEDVERATELSERAKRQLEQRQITRAKAEREAKELQLATLECGLNRWPTAVDAAATKLLDLDRMLDDVVLELARVTASSATDFDAAATLASELGRSRAFEQRFNRASIVNARLAVRRALSKARIEDDRDDVSLFLQSTPDDWRTNDLDGEQLATRDAIVARNEEERTLVSGAKAGLAAATKLQQPRTAS
jgi:hypothetical protein